MLTKQRQVYEVYAAEDGKKFRDGNRQKTRKLQHKEAFGSKACSRRHPGKRNRSNNGT